MASNCAPMRLAMSRTRDVLRLGGHGMDARRTLRYRILRACYRRGWHNVPLIGPKADGKRDCTPGFQAMLDEFAELRLPGLGCYQLSKTIETREEHDAD